MAGVLDQLIQKLGMSGIQNTFGQGNPMSQPNQAPGAMPPAGFGAAPQIVTPPPPHGAPPAQGGQQGSGTPQGIMALMKLLGMGAGA